MDATDSTHREAQGEAAGPAHATNSDGSPRKPAHTGTVTGSSATAAAGVSAEPVPEQVPPGPGTVAVTALVVAGLVVTGLAAAVAVVRLLRSRRRTTATESAPRDDPRAEPEPRPRHTPPTFVVDDDTGEFPSLR